MVVNMIREGVEESHSCGEIIRMIDDWCNRVWEVKISHTYIGRQIKWQID